MEIIVYLVTAIITIAWSVWVYIFWEEGAMLPEDAGMRFILIVTPSTFFLLTVLIGMVPSDLFRLDLMGLVSLDVLITIAAIILFISLRFKSADRKTLFVTIVSLYNIGAVLVLASIYTLGKLPSLQVRLLDFVRQWQEIDILSLNWAGVEAGAEEPSLVNILNKVLIAIFSYIPITVIRFIYIKRQNKKLSRELDDLRRNVFALEEKVEQYSKIRKP